VDRKEARRREKYWKRRKWQKKIEIAKVKIHVSGSTCLPSKNAVKFPLRYNTTPLL